MVTFINKNVRTLKTLMIQVTPLVNMTHNEIKAIEKRNQTSIFVQEDLFTTKIFTLIKINCSYYSELQGLRS